MLGRVMQWWRSQPEVTIPKDIAKAACEMLSSYVANDGLTVRRSFAVAVYWELSAWLTVDSNCDHDVNVCFCSDRSAVHRLGVLLHLEYPNCLFCELPLADFHSIVHDKCREPYVNGEDTP